MTAPIRIISVIFNQPDFLPYSYSTLQKYITVPFEYHIYDNAPTSAQQIKNQEMCKYLGLQYTYVPQSIHPNQSSSSPRAGRSLDYAIRHMYNTLGFRGILMICDSDLFLTAPYNPLTALGTMDFVGRSCKNMYLQNDPTNPIVTRAIYYFTNQFCILNLGTLPAVNEITFMPGSINGVSVDCGGLLLPYFEKYPAVKHADLPDLCSKKLTSETLSEAPQHLQEYFKEELARMPDHTSFSEVFDSVWLHFRAGSNWCNHSPQLYRARINNLYKTLCGFLIDWGSITSTPSNKYVISFSLYGDKPKYTHNSIMNAVLAQQIYPGWICRFYYDNTVPTNIVSTLAGLPNTELCYMTSVRPVAGHERMLWRFHAAADPTVAVMISRDGDSWLSFREAQAVKDWIQSDKGFHIIRDHCYHSQKIMGGMWGAKRGVIPDMKELCDHFSSRDTYDQGFLASVIYPRILSSVMVHYTPTQKRMGGALSNGYFPDGGIPLPSYYKIRHYLADIDIEQANTINAFGCLHCREPHTFFIGEMMNILSEESRAFIQRILNAEGKDSLAL